MWRVSFFPARAMTQVTALRQCSWSSPPKHQQQQQEQMETC